VESRYPYAGDEWSATARETLLDVSKRFEREFLAEGRSAYSIRMRAFVCEAEYRKNKTWLRHRI
jgi:hypothetical protein